MRLPKLPCGDDLQLKVAQGVLGGAVWPSAIALSNYLSDHQSTWLKSSNPVAAELGSGTGAVGLFAAALGARVVLTDVGPLTAQGYGGTSRLLHLLRENVRANRALLGENAEGCFVAELDWAQKAHAAAIRKAHAPDGFDLVLASDVIYQSSAHAPLANTISRLLCPANGVAFVAHEPRMFAGAARAQPGASDVQFTSFRDAAWAAGLTFEEVMDTRVEGVADKWHTVRIVRLSGSHSRRGSGR